MPLLTARTLKYSEHTICYHCVSKTSAQRHYISREPRNDVTYPDLRIGVGASVPVSEIEVGSALAPQRAAIVGPLARTRDLEGLDAYHGWLPIRVEKRIRPSAGERRWFR